MICGFALFMYWLGDSTVLGIWHMSALVVWFLVLFGIIEFTVEAATLS